MEDLTVRDAIIFGLVTRGNTVDEAERSLDELSRLLDTAGGSVFARILQAKDSPDPRTIIGSGKVRELKELAEKNGITLAVFDGELSPAQIRNLEDDLGGTVEVIDRSMLILDIFALHATSGEGKLQVELAQLRYTAPRLIGHGGELSRLGGGIGTRGPGETKLEIDRRRMKERIASLDRQLAEMEHNRRIMRASRDASGMIRLALVGYTNAGKSTLLNYLTGAGVLSEDKLFATLDPTTRRLSLPMGETVLLTDTVGFIRKLPHHLVKAFRSTLEEAAHADILLIVANAADPECTQQLEATERTLSDLGAAGKPTVYVMNQCDRLPDFSGGFSREGGRIYLSAKTGEGVDLLLSEIESVISEMKREAVLLIPYAEQGLLSALYSGATVKSVDYEEGGIRVRAVLDAKQYGRLSRYEIGVK